MFRLFGVLVKFLYYCINKLKLIIIIIIMTRATSRILEKTFLGFMLSVMVLQGSILVWAFGFMLVKLIGSIFV